MNQETKQHIKDAFVQKAPNDLSDKVLNKLEQHTQYETIISKRAWVILSIISIFVIIALIRVSLYIELSSFITLPSLNGEYFLYSFTILLAIVLLKFIQTIILQQQKLRNKH